jgi:hypothetical protein
VSEQEGGERGVPATAGGGNSTDWRGGEEQSCARSFLAREEVEDVGNGAREEVLRSRRWGRALAAGASSNANPIERKGRRILGLGLGRFGFARAGFLICGGRLPVNKSKC